MKRNLFWGISCVMLVFCLVFTGCPQPVPLSSDIKLSDITVAGVRPLSFGNPGTNWLTIVPGDIYLTDSQMADAQISPSPSASDATMYCTVTAPGGEPSLFDQEWVFDLQNEDIVWVEIFSPNLDGYLVYAFNIHKRTPELASAAISRSFTTNGGGFIGNQGFTSLREAKSLGTPAAAWNAVTETGELWVGTSEIAGNTPLGSSQSKEINFVITPETPDSVLSYALVTGDGEPAFTDTIPAITDTHNNDWLYIKSVSTDTINGETVVYKIKLVEKNDDYTLSSVKVNGADMTLGNMGYHSLVGQEAWGSYFNGAQLPAVSASSNLGTDVSTDVTFAAAPAVSTTVVKVGIAASNVDYLVGKFEAADNLGKITGSKIIGLEVTSELGESAYYRFWVYRGRTDVNLDSFTVNTAAISPLPEANNNANGQTYIKYAMPAAPVNGGWENVTLAAAASNGATIAYGSGAAANTNITSWTNVTGIFPSFTASNVAAVRITSENGQVNRYYKVRLVYGSGQADLTGLTIAGASIPSLPSANTAANGAAVVDYTMVAAGPWADLQITAAASANAAVAYAVTSAANAAPGNDAWNDTGLFDDDENKVASNQYVVIRVTPEDNDVIKYYKVRLLYGDTQADLTGLTIAGTSIPSLPAANTTVGGTAKVDLVMAENETWDDVQVTATASAGSTIAYALASTANAAPGNTAWNDTGLFEEIVADQYVVVRITSENNTVIRYYKVRLRNP